MKKITKVQKKNMNIKHYKQHRQNGRKKKHEVLIEKWFNNKPNMDNGSKGDLYWYLVEKWFSHKPNIENCSKGEHELIVEHRNYPSINLRMC